MKQLLLSITGGVILALTFAVIGQKIPAFGYWGLLPGYILAIFIPGFHSGLEDKAAVLYNIVFYPALIYGIWALVKSLKKQD